MKRTGPAIQIYHFSWPDPATFPENLGHASSYNQLINYGLGLKTTPFDDWLHTRKTLLIIDEAQVSYGFHSFWNDFLKTLASGDTTGPLVILFSSYGLPTETPVLSPPSSAPIHFSTQQRVSVRPLFENNNQISLYFTRPEFDDVVARVCQHQNQDPCRFRPSDELVDYLWAFSNGHPGGIRALLDALIESEDGALILRPFLGLLTKGVLDPYTLP